MTETELALAALAKATVDFLATLDGVGAEEYLTSPGQGRWSLAENAEHTTVVIRSAERLLTTRLLNQPLAADDPERRLQDADLAGFLTYRTGAIDAPEFVRPKGRWTTREDMTTAIQAATTGIVTWARAIPADLRAFGLPHPIFGLMDGIQWINFLAVHTDRHARQALEIRADLARD